MQVVFDLESVSDHLFYNKPIRMQLILNEQRVHGAKYYTVYPMSGNWPLLEAWALKAYGPKGDLWDDGCKRWYMNNSKFWFRNESDRTMFVLRWGNET